MFIDNDRGTVSASRGTLDAQSLYSSFQTYLDIFARSISVDVTSGVQLIQGSQQATELWIALAQLRRGVRRSMLEGDAGGARISESEVYDQRNE